MGAQQVLRTAACALLIAAPVSAGGGGWKTSGHKLHEPVAVIDLGPGDERRPVMAAAVEAGLDPVIGYGLDDALAGISTDRDGLLLAAAMKDAEHAFGALKCSDAVKAARTAIGLAAERQAAGIAVPELTHAWAYVLLCADKNSDVNGATLAATRLRALGGSTDIDASLLARYPEIDAVAGRELIELDLQPEVAGATMYVDFQPATGTHLVLPAGEHVIAAASGARRGYVAGPAVPAQKQVAIPMADQNGGNDVLAARVASWHGALPSPTELAFVLTAVHARVAIVRHANTIEAWGRISIDQPVFRLGGDDGIRTLSSADQLAELIADRVKTWNDHAPDPDQPLLVESDVHTRAATKLAEGEEPTKWWVYAAIGGALVAGVVVIYAHSSESDTQRVELHYP